MRRKLLFGLALVIILVIILAGYTTKEIVSVDPVATEPDATVEIIEIPLVYPEDTDESIIAAVKEGCTSVPADVIRHFNDDGYRIEITDNVSNDQMVVTISPDANAKVMTQQKLRQYAKEHCPEALEVSEK